MHSSKPAFTDLFTTALQEFRCESKLHMHSASGFDLSVAQIHGDMFNIPSTASAEAQKMVQSDEKNLQNLRSETIKHLPPDFS